MCKYYCRRKPIDFCYGLRFWDTLTEVQIEGIDPMDIWFRGHNSWVENDAMVFGNLGYSLQQTILQFRWMNHERESSGNVSCFYGKHLLHKGKRKKTSSKTLVNWSDIGHMEACQKENPTNQPTNQPPFHHTSADTRTSKGPALQASTDEVKNEANTR